jgi:TetR/AcrR family transcriptional regulator
MQLALPFKPFDPKALELRRRAAVRFLGTALFTDRVHGAKLANRVLADMPMPPARNTSRRIASLHVGRKAL